MNLGANPASGLQRRNGRAIQLLMNMHIYLFEDDCDSDFHMVALFMLNHRTVALLALIMKVNVSFLFK